MRWARILGSWVMRGGRGERASVPQASAIFIRTGTTWLAYLSLGYYSYLLNALGPAMPFLRGELRLSYAQGSLHSSAFAAGMIIAGLSGDRVTRRWGRQRTLLLGSAGLASGTVLLVSGRVLALTLAGALIMGSLGTLLLVLIPAVLSDAHAERRTTALTEANVVGSLSAVLAPLTIGACAASRFGWRAALVLGVVAVVPVAVKTWHTSMIGPARNGQRIGDNTRLPASYWAYWAVIVCAVSIEFCMIFWAADFLHVVAGLSRSVAAALVGVFLGALLLGRVVGSPLTRRLPAEQIMPGALGIAAIGFSIYWLAPSAPLRVAGLFVAGLGVAPLYPLALALAVGAAPGLSEAASARASLASGTAILAAPLILGWVADHVGMSRAYGVVGLLLVATLVTSTVARRLILRDRLAMLAGQGDQRLPPTQLAGRRSTENCDSL